MKFALHFGNNSFPNPDDARRIAQLAEDVGFHSMIAVDHVVFPSDYESRYPYASSGRLPGNPASPIPDPLIWMTWVAAATRRLRFMTGVPPLEEAMLASRGDAYRAYQSRTSAFLPLPPRHGV